MAAMTTTARPTRRFSPFLEHLLWAQIAFAAMIWAGFAAFVMLVTVAVSSWHEIEISAWDQASVAARWYTLFIGVHLGWSILPLVVTHGRTRREFMEQAVLFVAVFATATAAMVTVTFVIEAGVYRLAGWTQAVEAGQLYDSARQLHLIFVQAWLLIGLWLSGGIFISTAFYRNAALGGLAIGVSIVLAGISGIAISSDWGPFGAFYERLTGEDSIGGPLGVALHLACIAIVLALTWRVVRRIPIQSKQA